MKHTPKFLRSRRHLWLIGIDRMAVTIYKPVEILVGANAKTIDEDSRLRFEEREIDLETARRMFPRPTARQVAVLVSGDSYRLFGGRR